MPWELSNPPPDLAVSLRDRLGANVDGTIGVVASLERLRAESKDTKWSTGVAHRGPRREGV
jgi:hypothetical protein